LEIFIFPFIHSNYELDHSYSPSFISGSALPAPLPAAAFSTDGLSFSGSYGGSLLIVGPPTTVLIGVMFQISLVWSSLASVTSSRSQVIGFPNPGSLHLIIGL